jgi:hypothetical protein
MVGRAACHGWRARSAVHTTEVQADVDCLKCAKKMGFTPKPKAAPASPGGTCQVCFGQYRAPHKGSTHDEKEPRPFHSMANHGFQRPGDGYLYGKCPGVNHQPFEKDHERTDWYVTRLEETKASHERVLAQLKAGSIDELPYQGHLRERGADGHRKVIVILVKKGAMRTFRQDLDLAYGGNIPSFDELLQRAIAQEEGSISGLATHLRIIDARLKAWTEKELLP